MKDNLAKIINTGDKVAFINHDGAKELLHGVVMGFSKKKVKVKDGNDMCCFRYPQNIIIIEKNSDFEIYKKVFVDDLAVSIIEIKEREVQRITHDSSQPFNLGNYKWENPELDLEQKAKDIVNVNEFWIDSAMLGFEIITKNPNKSLYYEIEVRRHYASI